MPRTATQLPGESPSAARDRTRLYDQAIKSPGMAMLDEIREAGEALSAKIAEFQCKHHRCRCKLCEYARSVSPFLRDDMMVLKSNLDMNLSLIRSEMPLPGDE